MIIGTSQAINGILEEFESLPEIEKGQVSDQITIELSIIQDFCEAAKAKIERETRKFKDIPERIQRDVSGKCQVDGNQQSL